MSWDEGDIIELRWLVHWDARRRAREYQRQKAMSACEGKDGFDSFAQADKTIGHRLRQFAHTYHCTVCSKWHIGGRRVSRDRRLALTAKRKESVE